jgi:hypothetical protein
MLIINNDWSLLLTMEDCIRVQEKRSKSQPAAQSIVRASTCISLRAT